jgi:hypothetical protein
MSIALHLSNYKVNLCSSDCNVSNCSSHCDVRICYSHCEIHIYSLHCGVTMFGRLHCYYVRHLTMFGNAYHIGASVYVHHIVMLLCMRDGNITKFDTLRCLECLPHCNIHICLSHCDIMMFGTLQVYHI